MPSIPQLINLFFVNRVVSVTRFDLDYYTNLLRNRIPFSFSRFGDGEWAAILEKSGENVDGHQYFPELGSSLAKTLKEPGDYFYSMQWFARKMLGREIYLFVKKSNISISWHDSDVFHNANASGNLLPFITEMRNLPLVLVGPSHLRRLRDNCFNYKHFIEVPIKNCFLSINHVLSAIKSYESINPEPKIYSFSASMATNVMIHDLYFIYGKRNWFIDFGSLWEPYSGMPSRSTYCKLDWSMLYRKNFG